jgi:hypothetical protein
VERGPAKPPTPKRYEVKDEVVYAGRKETFAYLHSLGIINYSSWDDVYFLEKDGILHIFKYE